jgi:hypothetical protein
MSRSSEPQYVYASDEEPPRDASSADEDEEEDDAPLPMPRSMQEQQRKRARSLLDEDEMEEEELSDDSESSSSEDDVVWRRPASAKQKRARRLESSDEDEYEEEAHDDDDNVPIGRLQAEFHARRRAAEAAAAAEVDDMRPLAARRDELRALRMRRASAPAAAPVLPYHAMRAFTLTEEEAEEAKPKPRQETAKRERARVHADNVALPAVAALVRAPKRAVTLELAQAAAEALMARHLLPEYANGRMEFAFNNRLSTTQGRTRWFRGKFTHEITKVRRRMHTHMLTQLIHF